MFAPVPTVTDKYGLDIYNDDLFKSKHNLESQNIMTDRVSQDQCVNKNGVCLIELCRPFDLKIVNGRFGSDKGTGAFTCVTANVFFTNATYSTFFNITI